MLAPVICFHHIISGNAIPVGKNAAKYGLESGVPLNQQGYPNGITIFQVR
jgi:hypothetical protein